MKTYNTLEQHTSKIGSGLTPRGGNRSYVVKGIPLIRSQNVLMRSFSSEGLVLINEEQHSNMYSTEVKPRDILLNITGASIGRVCVVPDEICPANVNQHVCIIRCNDTLDPEYVAFYLSSPAFQSFIMQSQAGGTRQALTKEMIKGFLVPSVPINDQRHIAARLIAQLTEVEKARKALEAQLAETTNLSDSIIMDSINRASNEKYTLGDVLEEVKAGIGKNWASYPVLGATREGLAPAKEPPGKNPKKYKPVFPGTVFYNPMRILIGSIAFVDDDDAPGITSPDYVALKGKERILDSRWFYFWLRSPLGEQCIHSLARGAVRERMLFNRLAEGEITLPEYDIQQTASRALSELKPMRRAVEQKLNEINLIPAKILSQAFEMN
jgi:type I restriction enzyme S subunit